jgi:hypothetical protein
MSKMRCSCSPGTVLQFLRGDVPPEEAPSDGEANEDAESKVDGAEAEAEAAKTHIGVDHKDWAWEPSCHEVTALICRFMVAADHLLPLRQAHVHTNVKY